MANEVSTTSTNSLMTTDFLKELEPRKWLPRIQMLWPNSQVRNDSDNVAKGAEPGSFWLGQDTSLGKEFKATPIDVRPHALWLEHGEVSLESFSPGSDEFQTIKGMKSNYPKTWIAWGGDALLWLPEPETFAIYFCYGCARDPAVGQFFQFSRDDTRRNLIVRSHTIRPKRPGAATLFVPELVETDESYTPPTEDGWKAALELFQHPVLRQENDSDKAR